jgi:hypothetical protein
MLILKSSVLRLAYWSSYSGVYRVAMVGKSESQTSQRMAAWLNLDARAWQAGEFRSEGRMDWMLA